LGENMPLPCEFAVKAIIPAFRALIAKELIEYYQLKQENVAGLLGVTQPAISQYTRNVRGKTLDLDKNESIRLLAIHTLTQKNVTPVKYIVVKVVSARTVGAQCFRHVIGVYKTP
jgi:predicted transcriptional regulator